MINNIKIPINNRLEKRSKAAQSLKTKFSILRFRLEYF